MRKRPYSFVRADRRRWGLTQAELATLLGVASSTTVSRLERSVRAPTATILVACCILFRRPEAELFASFHESIEELVMGAAKNLHDEIGSKTDKRSLRKREFVEEVLRRISSSNETREV